jgi:cytochrome c oxidase subunit III
MSTENEEKPTEKRNFANEISPEVKEKMKKNLVYVGIFSVIMLFAGFTSGYYVSMGDSFWLKYPMPTFFWFSTASIAFSSLAFMLAIRSAKKNQQGKIKMWMAATLIFGAGFIYCQFKGYGELVRNGFHAVNSLVVTDGRYGDYFEVKYKDKFIDVDGNKFVYEGREMSPNDFKTFQNFMAQFKAVKQNKALRISKPDGRFEIYFNQQPLLIKNGLLFANDTTQLLFTDEIRLSQLAVNILDGRGDFFARGEYGKDFTIYYKKHLLDYKDRKLWYKGESIKPHLQVKAMESADSASQYLYLITFIHLLHVLIALIYLLKVSTASFRGDFNAENHLSLRLSALFWHFLGLLWVALLLFFIFIH